MLRALGYALVFVVGLSITFTILGMAAALARWRRSTRADSPRGCLPSPEQSEAAMMRVIQIVETLRYDICILTGDYRAKTWGPYDESLAGVARVCAALEGPVYGVLGNHDTIRMVPGLEGMGIRMLLNEAEAIERDGEHIHLAGIDDAHFYRMDNIEKAAENIPHEEFSILVTHTPEIYRQAAHADFDVLLSGHTHGGQIRLPGGKAIFTNSRVPRFTSEGKWNYQEMKGYTCRGAGSSGVPLRFNCPGEISLVTLHRKTV